MKKSIYICFLSISFMFLSCDMNDKNEGRFESDPTSGWVQFYDYDEEAEEIIPAVDGYRTPINIIYGTESVIEIPVLLQVPVNSNGTLVNYTITDIEGNSTPLIPERSGSLEIFKNDLGEVILVGNLILNIVPNVDLQSSVTFDVTLTGTNKANVTAGLAGDLTKGKSVRIRICPYNVGLTYNATAVPSVVPANGFEGLEFVQTLVPVVGTTNKYTVETVWGTTFFPCFIGNCNNVAAIRRWPAIITINDDFSITVTGNDPAFPNRYPQSEGTYDPCTDTFDIPALKQAVLTSNPFTTHVVYTPAP